MTNIVTIWKSKAAAAGTNITEIARRAGVPRQTIERWKNEEPLTIKLLRKIEAELDKAIAETKVKQ